MSKKREYKTTWVGDYKITIDICDNDIPCVMVLKHLKNDNIENIFGYYSKDVVDFFVTIISERKQKCQQISDLEAKLAESKEQLNNSEQKCLICNKEQEIEILKQQLAEKEKEIKKLKTLIDGIDKYGQYEKSSKNLVILDPERYYTDGHKLIIKTDKQDKIDFAVEKLKEVKRLFEEKYTYDVEESDFAVIYETDIDEIIDNQIKELKEGK